MTTIEAEREQEIDRRAWPRVPLRLPVRLVDTDATFGVVSGQTVDIGVGGLRARVDGPLSGSVEATVRIGLTSGQSLLCEAHVASGGPVEGGWEYGLAFRNLDATDVRALERLVHYAV